MKISDVSKKFNISHDTLRYYERIGLLPAVARDDNGFRNYQEVDCNWIDFILCMRNAGMEIETLIEYVNLFQLGDKTIKARKLILQDQRATIQSKIDDLKKVLDRLDYKISVYDEQLIEVERELSLHPNYDKK
jgi:DNA-binding transcriptional MerR regulator